jgi:hypothetical protein
VLKSVSSQKCSELVLVIAFAIVIVAAVSAPAHDVGPGMVITCTSDVSGVPPGAEAGVTVHNASTNQTKSLPLDSTASAINVCTTIFNASTQVGLRAGFENLTAVAIYGSGNSVTVSFATISQTNF